MSGLVMGFETKLRNEVSDMAREIFEVTKDRFHLKDPCRYILQGTWPKEAKMRACLDGSQIKAEIRKLEVVSALERFKDPDLMRGERITAEVRASGVPGRLSEADGICGHAGKNHQLVFGSSKGAGTAPRKASVFY